MMIGGGGEFGKWLMKYFGKIINSKAHVQESVSWKSEFAQSIKYRRETLKAAALIQCAVVWLSTNWIEFYLCSAKS